jgi:hypothetical protein
MIHIRCGDDILGKLEEAGLPGARMSWVDPLCDGPTPAGLTLDRWYATRADFIAHAYGEDREKTMRFLKEQDQALSEATEQDEIVLWFEHDLFDQIILIQLLDWFQAQDVEPSKLSLISIGQHPEVPRFTGFGNLSAAQLKELFPKKVAMSEQQMTEGSSAWMTFTSPDPIEIQEFVSDQNNNSLPFLRDALTRHLQQFPSMTNGLSKTEQFTLQVLAEKGEQSPSELFSLTNELEENPWLGDTMYWSQVLRLASAGQPPIAISGDGIIRNRSLPSSETKVSITPFGESLLSKNADFVKTNGIERWLGGAHLEGDYAEWRWDEASKQLIGV